MASHAVGISGQGTWETTLQARDLDGNLTTAEAYYDTVLGITWLADAYYPRTAMHWGVSNAWAANLNPYGSGITAWRLPTVVDTGTSGCNFSYNGTDCGYNVNTSTSEMAHLFYVTLGNKAYYDASAVGPQADWGLSNTGNFSNILSYRYWSSTEYALNSNYAWYFYFGYGDQHVYIKPDSSYAWAVHDGDVGTPIATSAVPLPASVWLLSSGLLGLLGVSRKKSARRFQGGTP
jgi:hypothetical protein